MRQNTVPDEVLVVGRRDDADARAAADAVGQVAVYRIHWLEVERSGHIAPVRRGLEGASGDIVAFLDDDTEPEPGWLGALLEPFSDKEVGCVGGRVVTPGFVGKVTRDAGNVRWYGQHSANLGAREGLVPVPVHGVMEGNWAWRRLLLKMLEFDPVLDFDHAPMYGLDLCLQADRHGYRTIYQPSARVTHHVGPRDPDLDRADMPHRARAYSRNYTYVSLKHMSSVRKAVYLTWSMLVGERGSYGLLLIPVDLLFRRRGVLALAGASFAGKWDGIRAWRRRSRP
jgi:GT2 family glycosyltransferase